MARRVVLQVRTELDDTDRELIARDIGVCIKIECDHALRALQNKSWDNLTIGLADAGDWGVILSDIMRKDINTVEEIRERVGRLDTSARTVWWDVLEMIESNIQS